LRESLKDQSPREVARALDQAKKTCWERIVLRLFRPAVKKPTQKQFEQFLKQELGVKAPVSKKKPAADSAVSDLVDTL